MATVDEFIDFLVETCEADGNTLWVEQLRADARKAIQDGRGTISSLTNSSINGKGFGRTVHMTPVDVARACNAAIRAYDNDGDDGRRSSTYADFRFTQR